MTPMLGIMASAISGNLTPTSPVAGYKVWLDASDTATITQSGGAVSQWTDKSANAYTFTMATAAYKPSTGVDTQNGKNVLTYGTNDTLLSTAAASTWTFLHNANSTIFVAFKQTNAAIDAFLLSDYAGSTANIGAAIYQENSGKLTSIVLRGASGTYAVVNKMGANTLGTAFTYFGVMTDPTNATASDRSDIRLKQAVAYKFNSQTGSVNNSAPTQSLRIGDYDTGGNEGISGTVGEILIYDSILSSGNILLNQQYLANKWGV
jgi:hypothetical protein